MVRYIRFATDADAPATTPDWAGLARYGRLEGDQVIETEGREGPDAGRRYSLAAVRLLPPCSPTKIVCVGRNYLDHAKELNNPVPEEPLLFLKPPSSLNAHGDAIVLPPASRLIHHEAELALIVGRQAKRVAQADAWDYIWGFTCLNDVTARDIQKRENKFTRAKGVDTCCPVGPWAVRRQDLDFAGLRVTGRVNGEVRQDAPVTDLLFGIEVLIEFITSTMTLEPGDLIATGTPAGVGPLEDGDVVEVEVSGLGVLRNPVVREG